MDMDQDLELGQLLVSRQGLSAEQLQPTIDEARNQGLPLGRYAAETGCIDRGILVACLRQLNGGIEDDQGYDAVEDALLASEVIDGGHAAADAVENARAEVFGNGGRLRDALVQQGLLSLPVADQCLQMVQSRSGICPTCFSTFENEWLRSVGAEACPICVEPWGEGNGNGGGMTASQDHANYRTAALEPDELPGVLDAARTAAAMEDTHGTRVLSPDDMPTIIGSLAGDIAAAKAAHERGETFDGMGLDGIAPPAASGAQLDPVSGSHVGFDPGAPSGSGHLNFAQTIAEGPPAASGYHAAQTIAEGPPGETAYSAAQTIAEGAPDASGGYNFAQTVADGGPQMDASGGEINFAQTVSDADGVPASGYNFAQTMADGGPSASGTGTHAPIPGTGAFPAAPGSGAFPPAPGSGAYPPAPGSGAFPIPGSGAYPPAPGTGAFPPAPGSGAFPPAPGSGAFPVPGSGAYPVPGTGAFPPAPGSGAFPPAPGSGAFPPAPGSGAFPPASGSGGFPPVPGSGAFGAIGSGAFGAVGSGSYPPAASGSHPGHSGGHLQPATHPGMPVASDPNIAGAPTAILDGAPSGSNPMIRSDLGGDPRMRASNPATAASHGMLEPVSSGGHKQISDRQKAPQRRKLRGQQQEIISQDAGFRAYLPFIALGLAGAAGLIVLAALMMTGGGEEGRRLAREARAKKAGGDLNEAVRLYAEALEYLGGSEKEEVRIELEETDRVRLLGEDALDGNGESAYQLTEVANNKNANLNLRLRALDYLTSARDKTTPSHIVDLIDDPEEDEEIRNAALRAVASTGGRDAWRFMGRALARDLVKDGERAFNDLLRAKDPAAVEGLKDLLELGTTQSEDKRERACERLAYFGKKESGDTLLRIIEEDASDRVKAAAIKALAVVAPARGVDVFVQALLDEGEVSGDAALEALEKASDKAVPKLAEKLDKGEPLAALALTRIKTGRSADALKRALLQGSWAIRGEILAKVVEGKYPKHLLESAVRELIRKATSGTQRPKRLELAPLVRAADYFGFEDANAQLVALQLFLESEVMQHIPLPEDFESKADAALGSGAAVETGNGTAERVKIAFFAKDGSGSVGFELEPGERKKETVAPGTYTLILDERLNGKPLQVGEITIGSGEVFQVMLGIMGILTIEGEEGVETGDDIEIPGVRKPKPPEDGGDGATPPPGGGEAPPPGGGTPPAGGGGDGSGGGAGDGSGGGSGGG